MPLSLAVHGAAIAVALAIAPIVARDDARPSPPTTIVFDVVRTARPVPDEHPPVVAPPRRVAEDPRPTVRAPEPAPVAPVDAPAPLIAASLSEVASPSDTVVCLSASCADGTGTGVPAAGTTTDGERDGAGGALPRVGGDIREPRRIHYVAPVYPQLAITARVGGTVVLECVIDRDGSVADVRVVTGHPLLTPAAVEAVRRWRYTPTLLNDTPIAVMMTVTVRFVPKS